MLCVLVYKKTRVFANFFFFLSFLPKSPTESREGLKYMQPSAELLVVFESVGNTWLSKPQVSENL